LQHTADVIEDLLGQSDEELKRNCCQEIPGTKKFNIKPVLELGRPRTRFRALDTDPQLEAAGDCVLPFKAMYKKLLEDFCVKANVSNTEPLLIHLTPPISDVTAAPYVRRAGYVYHVPFNVRSEINTAKRLVQELVNGSTAQDWLVTPGLTDIVDIWVAVKYSADEENPIAVQPLLPNWHAGEQSAVIEQKVKLDSQFNDDGIYWIMVLTWLAHLEGGVRG